MEELLHTLLANKSQEFFIIGVMLVVVLVITLLLIVPMSKIRAVKNQLFDIKDLLGKKDNEIAQLQREKKAIKTKNSLIEEKLLYFDSLLLELDSYKIQLAEKQEYIITLKESNQEHILKYQTLLKESSDTSFKFKSIQKRNEFLVEENTQFRTENKKILSNAEEQANRIFDAIRTNSTINKQKEMEQLATEFFHTNQEIYETMKKKIIYTNLLPDIDKVTKSQEELLYLYEKNKYKEDDLVANINQYQKIDQEIDIFYSKLSKENRLQDLGSRASEYILKVSNIVQKYITKEKHGTTYRIFLAEERTIRLDANLSLLSYQNYLDTKSRIEKEQALNEYLKIFETHLEHLIETLGEHTYCLMFIPNRDALNLLLKHRSHLFDASYKKRVLLVHPTTLLMTLQRIVTLWEHREEQKQANSLKVISDKFYESFADYHKDISNLSQELQLMQSRLRPANTKTRKDKMSSVTVWHNPRCSKSRETMKLLTERGVESDVVKYLDEALTTQRVEELLAMLGMEPRELMRTKEAIYRELNLKDENDPQKLIETMVAHPKLIERPIVIKDGKAVIGRPIENVVELLR